MSTQESDLPQTRTIRICLNGQSMEREVLARTHLVDFLRDGADLKGSHLGCEHGVCGACTVQLDGQKVDNHQAECTIDKPLVLKLGRKFARLKP